VIRTEGTPLDSTAVEGPRVAIDVRALQRGFKSHQGRGIGRYVRSLVEALLALDSERRLGFLADASAELGRLADGSAGRLHRIASPAWMDRLGKPSVHLRQHLAWPRRLRSLPFDLFHFCSQTDAPLRPGVPYVVTVLDLVPHRMAKEYARGKSRLRFALGRWLERQALRGARGLLAISEFTRKDLVDLLGIPPERIAVTPLGVAPGLAPASKADVEGFCRRHQLAAGYVLYVGGIDRRKNLPFLLEVMRAIGVRRPETVLVLAGRYRDDPDFPELVAEIGRLGLERMVRLLGYVPEEEIASLYSGAAVFAYPSLYEGFGLPPLEAMACGTPVVAADRTALPEVLGHAAVLADPEDVAEFAEALLAVLDRPDRARELAAEGRRWAARFTWEETARRTLEAYRRFAPPLDPTAGVRGDSAGGRDSRGSSRVAPR
jgi:glycosyltransferase involved in cell wall biosynthesis